MDKTTKQKQPNKKGVDLQRQANISNYRPQALKELYQGLLLGSPTRGGLLNKKCQEIKKIQISEVFSNFIGGLKNSDPKEEISCKRY